MRRRVLWATFLSLLLPSTVAAAPVGPACDPADETCLPTAEECAASPAPDVRLGRHVGSAAVCVPGPDAPVVYVGGEAVAPCGTIVLVGQPVTEADPNTCVARFPDAARFHVTVPSTYAATERRFPVVYLLAGGGGDERFWTDVEPQLADHADALQAIVVSVFTGITFHADWRGGQGDYETLFIDGIVPSVDATYRTVASREARAIAGFSMGGYAAAMLAARHPDRFVAAASFSGPNDLTNPHTAAYYSALLPVGVARYDDPAGPASPWGPFATDEVWWRDSDPGELAGNLQDVDLWIGHGTGTPSQAERDENGPLAALALEPELAIATSNVFFRQDLDAAGVDYRYEVFEGGHSRQTLVAQLRSWLPVLDAVLDAPDGAPEAFDHRSAQPVFEVWGWTFTADPGRAAEFLEVHRAGATGFAVTGSGMTDVVTAALFRPNQRVQVGLGDGGTYDARADGGGRLRVQVDLGPPHTLQQYTAGQRAAEAAAGDGYFVTTEVSFWPRPPVGVSRGRS